MIDKLLTETEVAEILRVKKETLQVWRVRGNGPPVTKLPDGGIRYKEEELNIWIDSRDKK